MFVIFLVLVLLVLLEVSKVKKLSHNFANCNKIPTTMTKFALLLVVSVALTLLLPEIFKIKIRTSSPSVTSSSEILHHVNTEEQLYQAQESIRDQLKSDPDTNITVLIAPGNYYNISLVLTKDDSPDPNSIVKFAAEDDSSPPTLHGGVLIPETDWTKSPSSPIWSAPLPPHMTDSHGRATFRTLTQDSLSANLASSPDVNSGYLNVTDFDQGGFTYSQGALPQKMDCEKSQCVVFTRAGYSSNFRKVRSEPRTKRASHNKCMVLLARFAHSKDNFIIKLIHSFRRCSRLTLRNRESR